MWGLVSDVLSKSLLLDSNSLSLSDMLLSDLLSNILLIDHEILETLIIDELNFLFTLILGNFLVKIA